MNTYIARILSPSTALGKSIRDAIIAALAVFLPYLASVDYGEATPIITGIIALILAQINRVNRPIKREYGAYNPSELKQRPDGE